MPAPTRSATLVAWGNAWLGGHVSYDDALAAITAGDVAHDVLGLPGEQEVITLGWALGRLRAAGVGALSLALPVPGDLTGVPGPPAFRAAALDAGEGVVATGSGPRLGLVPRVVEHGSLAEGVVSSVGWAAFAVEAAPYPAPEAVRDAERELAAVLHDATAELSRLDVARWRDDVAAPLAALRAGGPGPVLPPGYPGTAARLLATAERLGTVLELARRDDGAAVTGAEVTGRSAALRELERAVRRARLAAYNCFGAPEG